LSRSRLRKLCDAIKLNGQSCRRSIGETGSARRRYIRAERNPIGKIRASLNVICFSNGQPVDVELKFPAQNFELAQGDRRIRRRTADRDAASRGAPFVMIRKSSSDGRSYGISIIRFHVAAVPITVIAGCCVWSKRVVLMFPCDRVAELDLQSGRLEPVVVVNNHKIFCRGTQPGSDEDRQKQNKTESAFPGGIFHGRNA
jgi:hypothetical protein